MNENKRHYLKIVLNLTIALAGLLAVIFLLPRLMGLLWPFVVAAIIAALANPIVHFLEKKLKIRRKAGSVVTIIVVVALVALILYGIFSFLITQSIEFLSYIPEGWRSVQNDLERVAENISRVINETGMKGQNGDVGTELGTMLDALAAALEDMASSQSSYMIRGITEAAKNIPGIIIGVIMMFLSAYFFVAENRAIHKWLRTYLPVSVREKGIIIRDTSKKAVGGYLLAQLRIEVWMYLLLVIGLAVAGVRYYGLIAFFIAILDFFPVLGTGTVLIPWGIIKFLGAEYKTGIILLVLWLGGQFIRQLIQPHFVSDSMKMPPIPTLVLLYVGWRIGGVAGMILAVPIGLIAENLYLAGVFDTTKDSLAILIRDLNAFRQYRKADYEHYKMYEADGGENKEVKAGGMRDADEKANDKNRINGDDENGNNGKGNDKNRISGDDEKRE